MAPISPIDPTTAAPAVEEARGSKQEARELRNAVEPDVSPESIQAAVEANRQIVFGGRTIEFDFDKNAGRVVVRVKSADTDEILRQLPPEDYLRFVTKFRELLGIVFDEVV